MRAFVYGFDPFPEPPPYVPRYSRHKAPEAESIADRVSAREWRGWRKEHNAKRRTLRTHRTGR